MDKSIFELKNDEKPLENIDRTCGFASILKEVGVIGDSLASGEFEATDESNNITYHDMYEYSWPSVLERITGTKYYNYSRGGMTFKEFYETWADKNNFWEKRQSYIVALGNNDLFVFNHNVGSHLDIDVLHPENNKDTFFGYMGKVLSKLKSLEKDARIFLVSMLLDNELKEKDELTLYVLNEMKEVIKLYSFTYLIDLTTYGVIYNKEVRSKYALGYHPNAMGYYIYALMIGNYIDYIIKANYKDFFELPFIGKNLHNSYLDK